MLWISKFCAWLKSGFGPAQAIAIIIALPPFYDLLSRKWEGPVLDVQIPRLVNFRSAVIDVVKPIEEMSLKPTGATVLVTYLNRGGVGQGISIVEERLKIEIGSNQMILSGWYETELLPKESQTWFGDIKPWLPTFLDGGMANSREVAFFPVEKICDAEKGCRDNSDTKITWGKFRKLVTEADETVKWASMMIEAVDGSGSIHTSPPCYLDITKMRDELNKWRYDPKKLGYYWIQPNCWPEKDS